MGVPGGTLVAVPGGAVPVEGLRATDRVLALRDEPCLVTGVMLRAGHPEEDEDDSLRALEIITEHGSLVVSDDQYVLLGGLWYRADRVIPGDPIVRMLPRWPSQRRRRRKSRQQGVPHCSEQVTEVRRWSDREPLWDVKVAGEHCYWADGFLVRG